MDTRRLGLLWVTRASGTHVGTGYAVTDGLILTAHHVIFGHEGDEKPEFIEFRYAEGEEWLVLQLEWAPSQRITSKETECDACLLQLPLESPCTWGEAPTFAWFDRSEPVRYESAGFPFASRNKEHGTTTLDTTDVRGELRPHDAKRRNLYGLDEKAAAKFSTRVLKDGKSIEVSEWAGLSGGPIFSNEARQPKHLLGVMRSVPRSFEGKRLEATPIQALLEIDAFREALGSPLASVVPSTIIDLPLFEKAPANNPASLLNARFRVVPYFKESHQEAIDALEPWCGSDAQVAVRLLTGPGGSGKTRLLREWCEKLRREGWRAGFLPGEVSDDEIPKLIAGKVPTCVVFDYAEVRPTLKQELGQLLGSQREHKLRVVLLAREKAEWWDSLKKRDDALRSHLEAHETIELAPIQLADELRTRVYESAYRAFNYHVHRSVETPEPPPFALEEKQFERTLYLHMAALSSVEKLRDAEPERLLARILEHEQDFWAKRSDLDDLDKQEFEEQASRLVAALTLRGGSSHKSETTALDEGVDGPGQRFFQVLRRLYPGKSEPHNRYLSGLEPDLLGEALVRDVLTQEDSKPFLDTVLLDPTEVHVLTTLTVLGRISVDFQEARQWLEHVLVGAIRKRGSWKRLSLWVIGQGHVDQFVPTTGFQESSQQKHRLG